MPPLVIVRQLELCTIFIVLFYFLPGFVLDNNLDIFFDVLCKIVQSTLIDKYMGQPRLTALLKVLKIINLIIIQHFYRFFIFYFYHLISIANNYTSISFGSMPGAQIKRRLEIKDYVDAIIRLGKYKKCVSNYLES